MTKKELIERIHKRHGARAGLTKKSVAVVVDGLFTELGDYFVKTRLTRRSTPRFTYPGFGSFVKKQRRARFARHPRTGADVEIPPSQTLSFTCGPELKALLNESR